MSDLAELGGFNAALMMLASFVTTTVLVVVAFIAARRILMDLVKLQGRQTLLASAALATLGVVALLLALRDFIGSAWLDVPLTTTAVSGLLVIFVAAQRKP